MRHDWILDVLSDLKGFAQYNGLPGLAEQLDDARLVAVAELAAGAHGAPVPGVTSAYDGDVAGAGEGM